MDEEEAIMLMLKTVGHEDLSDEAARETAKSVVVILGCLALAIDQAGALSLYLTLTHVFIHMRMGFSISVR